MLHRSAGSKPITGNIPSHHQCMNQTLVLPVPLAAPCPSLWYNIRRAAICSLLPSPAHLAAVGMDDAGVPIWVTSGARYTDLLSVTFAILSGLAVGSLCGMAILKSAQIWRYHSYGAPCKTLSSSSMAPCVGSPVSCPALVQAATHLSAWGMQCTQAHNGLSTSTAASIHCSALSIPHACWAAEPLKALQRQVMVTPTQPLQLQSFGSPTYNGHMM